MEPAPELNNGTLWPAGGIRLQGLATELFYQRETGRPKRSASAAGSSGQSAQKTSRQQRQGQQCSSDAASHTERTFGGQPINRGDLRLGRLLIHCICGFCLCVGQVTLQSVCLCTMCCMRCHVAPHAVAVATHLAGVRLSHSSSNVSVLACTWCGNDAVIKLVQPRLVSNPAEVQPLQLLMANEAKLYAGRLAPLQGASSLASFTKDYFSKRMLHCIADPKAPVPA